MNSFLKKFLMLTFACVSVLQISAMQPSNNGDEDDVELGLIYLGAARRGDLRSVRMFTKSNFDMDSKFKDINGEMKSILHVAVEGESLALVRFLLNEGANVNLSTSIGMTPLHSAAFCLDSRIAQILIECGADVNAQDDCGNSPLSFAKFNGNVVTIKLLVKAGARE